MEMIIVETVCPFCGCINEVEVPMKGFFYWKTGMPIQTAMPQVDPEIREALISGICADCWEKTFSDPEDEDEEDYEPDYDLDAGFDPYMGEYTWDC